jgi:hypothetical protein
MSSQAAPLSFFRGNSIGHDGWDALLDGLAGCTRLYALNGSFLISSIMSGVCEELVLSVNELGPAAERFVRQSTSTLTRLDLR